MKMRIKVLITFFVFMLLICGCSKKIPNYFRKIKIDGRYEVVGRYPISEEMRDSTICYHFVYNENKKLIKVEHLLKGKLHNRKYEKYAQILFEYSDEYETRIFQDSRNRPVAKSEGVYSIRLKLDKNNYYTSLFNYDKQGVLTADHIGVTQYLWTLNVNGFRIKSLRINAKGDRIEGNDGFYEVSWKHDDFGNIIETSTFGTDNQLKESEDGFAIMRWKHDDFGNVTENSYYDADEQLKEDENGFAVKRWKYDEQGICIEIKVYNDTTNLVFKLEYLYDDNGKYIKTVIYDDKGNKIEELDEK